MPSIAAAIAASPCTGFRRAITVHRGRALATHLALALLTITAAGCASNDRAQSKAPEPRPSTTTAALGAASSSSLPRDPIRVLRELDDRRLKLTANARKLSDGGDTFYVCLYGPDGVSPVQVLEHVTNRPLRARIDSQSLIFPTARLTGEKPPELNLRGAILLPHPPLAILTNTSQVTVDDPMLRTDYPPPTG